MAINQGEIWWANLSVPTGSEPGLRRPVVVIQRDSINRSIFQTVLVVPLTKQTRHSNIPGNVLLGKATAGLPRASLARCTHVMVIDKARLTEKIGTLPKQKIDDILREVIWVLGGSPPD